MSKMNIEQFLNLSYTELQEITRIDRSNWSKYFNAKHSPGWKTINRIADSTGMTPSDVMFAMRMRRENVLKKVTA